MSEHRGVVLVVDDEPIVREVVCSYLTRDGYRTLEAADGTTAKALLLRHRPDLAILDVMLPGIDGLELCRIARDQLNIAVIMLSARGEESDRIVGLELGADDYLVKPFSPRELVARVHSVLRRTNVPTRSDPLVFDELAIDPSSRDVTRAGEPVRLTAREFDLLVFLARHPRQVFSRDQLMDGVWGYQAAQDTGTVTVHMRRLREKLEPDPSQPRWLETVWGVGYRFAP
jgi:two-component system, OmpR family, response regulator ResD